MEGHVADPSSTEEPNEGNLPKIQKPEDDYWKTNEEPLEKLQDDEYTKLKGKLKYQSTILNHLVDAEENEIINIQMKEEAIDASLKNELLLLNDQLNMYEDEKLKLLQSKEQLESEYQNERELLKEVQDEMNSTGRMLDVLKKFFASLECDYKMKSNDLNYLINSEEIIYNKHRQLYEEFDTKEAELVKLQEDLDHENDQLTTETQNLQENVKQLQNLHTDKEEIYLAMKEEYNQDLNRYQELLNTYKIEEKLNKELTASLKSLSLEDLISERETKRKEMELNLQLNKQVMENISNDIQAFSDSKKNKVLEMNMILQDIAKNDGLIDGKEQEIRLLQTKISDCDKSISEIKDTNDKIVFNLQKEIEYTQGKLQKANRAIDVEKQLQDTYRKDFTSDRDRKEEIDGMMKKHIQLKDILKITNNLNMSKIAEIKDMQKNLKNKLTENNSLLLILQKENMEAEIAFKREKELIEKEIEEMEKQYKTNKEKYENKLTIIRNEIYTFTQESEKIEKERQEKLQRFLMHNRGDFENIKACHARNIKKNEEIQVKINEKRNVLYNLINKKEKLARNVTTMRKKVAKNQTQKSSATIENRRVNAGILKTNSQTSRFPPKKVTFSTSSNTVEYLTDVGNTSSNDESLTQVEEEKPISKLKPSERLFDTLKEEYDIEQALKKKKL